MIMEQGERAFMRSARRADIEQSEIEGQAFSQIIDLVEQLKDQEAVTFRFGNDQDSMQRILDGLGVGQIKNPAEQISYMELRTTGGVEASYGQETTNAVMPDFQSLPITDSIQVLQAGMWDSQDFHITTPESSVSSIHYQTEPSSELHIKASCSIQYEIIPPYYDMDYAYNMFKKGDSGQKMELLADYMNEDTPDDRVSMPGRSFSFTIMKARVPLRLIRHGLIDAGPVARELIGEFNYQNGTFVPIVHEWDT